MSLCRREKCDCHAGSSEQELCGVEFSKELLSFIICVCVCVFMIV